MTDRWTIEHWREIDGNLWRRWFIQTGARRTARLKAVPSAAWLGVGAAVLLDAGQCCADGRSLAKEISAIDRHGKRSLIGGAIYQVSLQQTRIGIYGPTAERAATIESGRDDIFQIGSSVESFRCDLYNPLHQT